MGATFTRTDFEWVYSDQPHTDRRTEILKKYPQVRRLMGQDHTTTILVTLEVIMQLIIAYILRDAPLSSIIIVAYCLGGTINHSLVLSLHEIAHNLAAGQAHPYVNRLIGIWANIPLGIPASVSFKKYHNDHHKFLGDYEMDPDLPHPLEAWFFSNSFGRVIWLFLQTAFYSLRPLARVPKPPTFWEGVNAIAQIIFDALWLYFVGLKSMFYFLASSILGLGWNPISGHFVAEHYMFVKGYETYSYYGPLNAITYNVGYHNEHHDFPNIPWTKLPELRRIAPEYYNTLPAHESCMYSHYFFNTFINNLNYYIAPRRVKSIVGFYHPARFRTVCKD